jgi:RNA-directed DNA polymerase
MTRKGIVMPGESPVSTGEPSESALYWAERRVREIQTKLHQRARHDPARRFDDLFNLVADPGFLLVAWERVRGNTGGRSPGIDGMAVTQVKARAGGVEAFLREIREALRRREFRPLPVRESKIPKPGGKTRRLGIPTVTDRVVQAALKLVLEPVFEADFSSSSYGFRPNRRAQDAIAEIHYLTSGTRSYFWVLDADIEACFDSIDHPVLMDRVRRRIADKRVLALVKAFLKAGILTESGDREETHTGTPQGGILSPLLANIALHVLDEHVTAAWGSQTERAKNLRQGRANYRIVRYADDFVILVAGQRARAEQLREEIGGVLSGIGLRFSAAKTSIVHIDEGFDFLGFRIQRRRKRGTDKRYVYTIPSATAVNTARQKIKALTSKNRLPDLRAVVLRVNSFLRGWSAYYQYGVSSCVFNKINRYAWQRVTSWIRKHHGISWKVLFRRYMSSGRLAAGGITLTEAKVADTRYRYRGYTIPTPWTAQPA